MYRAFIPVLVEARNANPAVIGSMSPYSPCLGGLIFLRRTLVGVTVPSAARLFATSTSSELLKTGLYEFHMKNGAKMVPFAGFSMPLLYGSVGQVASHNHVRSRAGLFDVGHMVQSFIEGPTATEFMEWITPASLSSLSPFSSTLSVILNEQGGIIDDSVLCKHASTKYYVVTNAARRDRDINWIEDRLVEWNAKRSDKDPVTLTPKFGQGLVALQGPTASAHLQKFTGYELPNLLFGTSAYMDIAGVECHVARGGYTGEDGFEISIPPESTVEVTQQLAQEPVQLAGLAARDSLRLEAGMCLYGHDLDETTSPVEANLSWVIGKDRRANGTFIGAETVLHHLKNGVARRRVGFIGEGPPAREGAEILAPESQERIGVITSGIPSPTLGKNIAMGYIESGFHKKGTEVEVIVRGQPRKAVVSPMPFVPSKYWRGTAVS